MCTGAWLLKNLIALPGVRKLSNWIYSDYNSYRIAMKILVIADSHGYGLAEALVRIGDDIEVKTVSVGSTMVNVWEQYKEELYDLQSYRPDHVCVHFGHNDIVWHARHNVSPKEPELVMSLVMGYRLMIQEDFPVSTIWISCLFPRTVGPRMDHRRVSAYNRIVYDFGCAMREVFPPPGNQVHAQLVPVVLSRAGTCSWCFFPSRWVAPE
jgi:hypothetical protein